MEDRGPFTSHCQCHGCWWAGDARSQCISSHSIDLLNLEVLYFQCQHKCVLSCIHYNAVIMSAIASQITSLTIVYLTVYSGADQRKHQSSASLAFVRGIHRWPVNSPHKGPVTRKMFPFDDVIMWKWITSRFNRSVVFTCVFTCGSYYATRYALFPKNSHHLCTWFREGFGQTIIKFRHYVIHSSFTET